MIDIEKVFIIEKIKRFLSKPRLPVKTEFVTTILEIKINTTVRITPDELTVFDSVDGMRKMPINKDEYTELINLFSK